MATVSLYATKDAYVDSSLNGNRHGTETYSISKADAMTNLAKIVFGLESLPANLQYKELLSAKFYLYAKVKGQVAIASSSFCWSDSDFSVSSVKYTNLPRVKAYSDRYNWIVGSNAQSPEQTVWTYNGYGFTAQRIFTPYEALQIIKAKSILLADGMSDSWTFIFSGLENDSHLDVYTSSSAYKPYLQLEYGSDVGLVVTPTSQTSGYFSPYNAKTFSWRTDPASAYSFVAPDQASAVFVWKAAGSSTEHTVSISGATKSVTIPANTFPANTTIQWQVRVTATSGTVNSSNWYTLSTDAWIDVSATNHTGGYINPHAAQTFNWACVAQRGYPETPPVQGSAVFSWKETGSPTVHTVTIADSTQYVTVAAETLPAASGIQWMVTVNGSVGGQFTSPWYSLSTADTLASAELQAPLTTVEDGSEPITFLWIARNSSGSVPTGADVQFSTDGGTNWSESIHITGSDSFLTVTANYFSAGDVAWRVRVYNIDAVAGEWSYGQFVVLVAPPAPAVTVVTVPFATVTWQSSGQQAYKVSIDGKVYGPFFGDGKTFSLSVPLEDGAHSATVEIQGMYGLWSQPSEVVFTIENDPGEDITLLGDFSADAALSWETDQSTADFLIFRDGALIGHTVGNRFVDRFVLGEHSYTVINRLPSGNYSRSNVVTGRMCVCRPMAAAFDGGEWIPLKYSEKSMAEQRFTWSRTHSLRHIAGTKYPVLELSPFEDLSGTYDAAFPSACCAETFRALRGKVVIIKSREGKVVIGALVNVSEVVNSFYLSMQFTIEQIAWEDFVDDQDS